MTQRENRVYNESELFSELEVPVKIEYIQHIPLGGDILLGGEDFRRTKVL